MAVGKKVQSFGLKKKKSLRTYLCSVRTFFALAIHKKTLLVTIGLELKGLISKPNWHSILKSFVYFIFFFFHYMSMVSLLCLFIYVYVFSFKTNLVPS